MRKLLQLPAFALFGSALLCASLPSEAEATGSEPADPQSGSEQLATASPTPLAAPARSAPAVPSRGALAPLQGGVDDIVTPGQVQAVERGLAWLASRQTEDGSWVNKIGYKLNDGYSYTQERSHVGVTSLACIAFLAGGHLPGRGEYGEVVEKGLNFVLGCVQEDGYVTYAGSRMYSHAFATLFLAEIYGMTHSEDVKRKLQRAVDFIVNTQNEEGGWRYEPYAAESDMSIVVCQVIALRAARNIGIRVPRTTVDRASKYVVDSAVTEENMPPMTRRSMYGRGGQVGTFHYQKDVHSRSSFPLTSAGVTALNGLGIYSDAKIKNGLEFLRTEMPEFNDKHSRRGHYKFWYGHYYGVQAMYTAGAPYWKPYFEELRGTLLRIQKEDGSFPNEVGPGPEFGTAMAVLILEIPYRFLPIFQR